MTDPHQTIPFLSQREAEVLVMPVASNSVWQQRREAIKGFLKVVIVVGLVIVLAVVLSKFHRSSSVEHLLEFIKNHRTTGIFLFSFVYIVGTGEFALKHLDQEGCIMMLEHNAVIFIPVAVLSVASGAIFGLPLGAAIVWVSAVTGETIAFFVGRLAVYCSGLHCAHFPYSRVCALQVFVA
jgi:hypothetical protein